MKFFKKNKLNSKGFSHVELLVVVVVVLAVAGVGYIVYHHDKSSNTAHAGSWLLLASSTNKETTESVYACLDRVSNKQWIVNGLGTLTPAVSDSSKYTAGINLGNNQKGGSSVSNKWLANASTTVWGSYDPQNVSYSVTPVLKAPKANPFLKGGGGMPVADRTLPPC